MANTVAIASGIASAVFSITIILILSFYIVLDGDRFLGEMIASIPEPYREMGSIEFASFLVKEAKVALSPGIGFGPEGDGHVRFALIENEQRIGQAVRGIRRALPELGI